MSVFVDDFLAHNGVLGMKWGKRSSSIKTTNRVKAKAEARREFKPGLSKKQKVAIVVGAGALVVGISLAAKSLDKNGKTPMSNLINRPEFEKGQKLFKPAPIPPQAKPARNSNATKPKAPSPYPMTPIIATPILDEIMKKYKF